jgi:hypothetical protein
MFEERAVDVDEVDTSHGKKRHAKKRLLPLAVPLAPAGKYGTL